MADNPVILITRPEPQASRFAESLRAALGPEVDVVVSPLLAPRFFGDVIDGTAFEAAVFTSETGVAGAARLWEGPKGMAFAVGDRTAEAASALGWLCDTAKGAGPDLADKIAASGLKGPFVWPKGRHGGESLRAAAKELGIGLSPVVVYEQEPSAPSRLLSSVLDGSGPVIVPLFSPRSAKLLRAEAKEGKAQLFPVAISRAAADAFADTDDVQIAARPDADAMTSAIAAIFHDLTS